MSEPLFDPEMGKAQWVRVADVLIVGPLMMWGGARIANTDQPLPFFGGLALASLGFLTVAYNASNWAQTDAYMRRVERTERERTVSGLTA